MGNFLAELKRRNIYRIGAGYVVVAWVLAQAIDLLSQIFKLPDAIAQPAILLLAAGLPVALIVAWIVERKPQETIAGAVRSQHTAVDWALFSVMALLVALTAYQQLSRSPVASVPSGVDAARLAAASPAGAISIAVLPFANLSGDASQEFFSDGMTEEITAALAKVPDLRVVARTSAFEFKNKNVNIKTMGETLGATHLIEGSVRKAGDRLRVTVQLIKAIDGTHVWAENYDRQQTDIFAIQEDIARTVTSSLNMSLGLKPGENLVNNRGIDTESYEKYLRARALFQGRGGVGDPQGVQSASEGASLLEDVLARNPNYAPAWSYLALSYGAQANRSAVLGDIPQARAQVAQLLAKSESALQKAIQLDSGRAVDYAMLAWLARAHKQPLAAEPYLSKALALDPLDSNVLWVSGMLAASAGRLREALDYYERGHAVDPLYPNLANATARLRWLNGRTESAIALAKTLRPADRAPTLALIYASLGRFTEASDALMELAAGDSNSGVGLAARLLRTASAKKASPEDVARLPRGMNNMLFLLIGASERSLETYERLSEVGHVNGDRGNVWHPLYSSVRKTERFKTLMRDVGLVEYWRARGWPEFCHPTTGDDFACK